MKRKQWLAAVAAVVMGMSAPLGFAQQAAPADGYQVGDRLQGKATAKAKSGGAEFREITWDDLIPTDWHPEKFLEELKLGELQDNDPRAAEAMEKMRAEWDRAPLVERYNGQRVRIPGFVVPLESDGKTIREFLLVPYFGACVHVPPPPANQLIHVIPDRPVADKLNMMPVWVNGVIAVHRVESDLGNAGYQLRAMRVEEYKEPLPK